MMPISAILTRWIAWRTARKRERELIAAERARNATARQMAYRKEHNMEWKPLLGILREETNASLRASVGRV